MQTQRKTYRKICQHCGKEFLAYTSVTAFCSTRCANLAEKNKKRYERLRTTSIQVRETQRLALLDKNHLTLSDAAKLMQISRGTLYKIIEMHSIKLLRFTDRTVRIARQDLEKQTEAKRPTLINTTAEQTENILANWISREQVMEKYEVTHRWFYSTIKKHKPKAKVIGSKAFYDVNEMERIFNPQDYANIKEWYTFDEVRTISGMKTESICEYCKTHKIPSSKKNGGTYISQKHWDNERGTTIDHQKYITMQEISDKYKRSKNHLYTILKDNDIERRKIGNFVYFNRQEVEEILKNILKK
ncbi:MAG: excisionase family DNA-binding protein [Bacteroidales bacterium]|nr:excisionase family DNA-binding protein [Bacteroidales bacterium]